MKELSVTQLAGICDMLAELLEAGKPLPQAVEMLAKTSKGGLKRRLIMAHEAMVRRGAEPGAAFARAGFPEFFCAQVKVASQTGEFVQTFKELAEWYHWRRRLKARIRAAVTYPAILAATGAGIVFYMLWSVIPRLKPLIEVIPPKERPQFLVDVFHFSLWMHAHPTMFFGSVVGTVVCLFLTRRYWLFLIKKYLFDLPPTETTLRLPWFRLYYYVDLAGFFKSLSVCLTSGLDILQSLHTTRDIVMNARLRAMVKAVRKRISRGETFAEAVNRYMILPVVRSYLEIAEETGDFAVSCRKISDYLFGKVDAVVGVVAKFMEVAVLLGVLSILAAFIVKFATALYSGMASIQ